MTPVIPSHVFAGVVAEVGPGVGDLVAGDEVFGLVPFDRDGAAAEYVVVPSSSVAGKPPDVPDIVAAAAALPALTALEALSEHAQLQRAQRVLTRGGTGGVRSFFTQFARELGAHVAVTAPCACRGPRDRSWGPVRYRGGDGVHAGRPGAVRRGRRRSRCLRGSRRGRNSRYLPAVRRSGGLRERASPGACRGQDSARRRRPQMTVKSLARQASGTGGVARARPTWSST